MILPRKNERGVVVFRLLPSIPYRERLAGCFALIALGLIVQVRTGSFLPGALLLALGNVLLLVKGFDNRVDFGAFEPDAHWERVGIEKLQELRALHQKIKRWDRSALDISNPVGVVVFMGVALPLAIMALGGSRGGRILALNALVLLVPHWMTGIRSILVKPKLLVRIEAIEEILEGAKASLQRHQVIPMMLLRGGEARIPEDLKFKVDIAEHHPDFLGLYGQVVINEVQGTSYPYFYVVLVARKGFGLVDVHRRLRNAPPRKIKREFKRQQEVEVLVIRQRTSKTSGYHTEPDDALAIFREGLSVAEEVGAGVPT